MKTVFLHVGNFKTGTSAIQRLCSTQRGELVASGLDYLQSGRPSSFGSDKTSHAALPLSLAQMLGQVVPAWYRDRASYRQLAAEVKREIAESDADSMLVSSEEFYRIPGWKPEQREVAKRELGRLFDGTQVKVIIYVREPFGFSKSWYNQVNKDWHPVRRFADFFSRLRNVLLMPSINANFWRDCFGWDCLVVRAYNPGPEIHLSGFLDLVSPGVDISPGSSSATINRKLSESNMEAYRVAKVLELVPSESRAEFLESQVTSDNNAIRKLQQKISRTNRMYNEFCVEHNLLGLESQLTFERIMAHESRVNTRVGSRSLVQAYRCRLKALKLIKSIHGDNG